MTAISLQSVQRQQAIALARATAITNAVELNHRYRMARVQAEQEAIRVRRKNNIWRSRYVRRAAYLTFMLAGAGMGWWASQYHSSDSARTHAAALPVSVEARAPVQALKPTAPLQQEYAGQIKDEVPPALSVVDAVDVPFVRTVSELGKTGISTVRAFKGVNDSATRFRISGVFAIGESPDLARSRALAVASTLEALGVSRDKIEMESPIASQEDSNILSGARLLSLGPALRDPSSIRSGAPLSPSVDTQGIEPAFKPSPIGQSASAEEATMGGVQSGRGEEVAQELTRAVNAAAARQKPQTQTVRPQVAKAEGSGVFVSVKPRSPVPDPQSAPTAQVPTQTSNSETAYTIVSRLEGSVLVRVGNQVRHVKIGEALPDGKILGRDLSSTLKE